MNLFQQFKASFLSVLGQRQIFSLFFIIAVFPVVGQLSYEHKNTILLVGENVDGNIQIVDDKFQRWQASNFSFSPSSLPIKMDTLEYTIDQEGYLLESTSQDQLISQERIYDLIPYESGWLVAMENGLRMWYPETMDSLTQAKQFNLGIRMPNDIRKIAASDTQLLLLTGEKQLYAINLRDQLLNFVSAGVDKFFLDAWNCLWYTQGVRLVQNKQFVNTNPPYFKSFTAYNRQGKAISNGTQINESDLPLRIEMKAQYLPEFNQLNYSFKLNNSSDLVSIDNIAIVSELRDGRNLIVGKATTEQKYNVFSEPFELRYKSASVATKYLPWLLGALGFLFLLGIINQFRLKAQLSALEIQKEKIKQRLIKDAEKAKVGQVQMSPHFLFNCLNSIGGLIALNKNKESRLALKSFASVMRNMLNHSLDEKLSLKEELAFLEAYLELEQMVHPDLFTYKINNLADLDLNLPPMLIQPFLENSIKHGFNGRQRDGELQLHLIQAGNNLKVSVKDNGIGLKAARIKKNDNHRSAAMQIISQRLKTLNKWSEHSIQLEEIFDEAGTSLGTEVLIYIPIIT